MRLNAQTSQALGGGTKPVAHAVARGGGAAASGCFTGNEVYAPKRRMSVRLHPLAQENNQRAPLALSRAFYSPTAVRRGTTSAPSSPPMAAAIRPPMVSAA